MSDANDAISAIVRQACIDLFAYYEIELAPGATPRALSRCGVIGFSGHDLRGSVMLGCTDEVLRAADVQDWLGELTNQLLGRIKNRLIQHDIAIYSSLPVVLAGEQIVPLDVQSAGHLFSASGGIVSLWFDALLRPGLVLAATRASIDCSGQVYLF
jgi:Chemotaxis phosphatase CheX